MKYFIFAGVDIIVKYIKNIYLKFEKNRRLGMVTLCLFSGPKSNRTRLFYLKVITQAGSTGRGVGPHIPSHLTLPNIRMVTPW